MPDELTLSQRLVPLLVATVIAAIALELIRRRKLREKFAMIWLTAVVCLMVVAIWPRFLWRLSSLVGVHYQTMLVLICFAFLAIATLGLAAELSRLGDDARRIAQRLALLEQRGIREDNDSDHADQ